MVLQSKRGTGGARRRPAYHERRRVACTACLRPIMWYREKRGDRLRDHVSPCCSSRMRTRSWSGWTAHERSVIRERGSWERPTADLIRRFTQGLGPDNERGS